MLLQTARPYLSGGPLDASTNPPKQSGSSAGDLLPHLVLLEDRVAFNGRLDPVEERHFIRPPRVVVTHRRFAALLRLSVARGVC